MKRGSFQVVVFFSRHHEFSNRGVFTATTFFLDDAYTEESRGDPVIT
jgi:hypothetical protein